MRILLFGPMVVAIFVAQTTVYHLSPGWHGIWPDAPLILALFGGAQWGRIRGLQFGAAIGLLQDFLSYGSIGAFAFTKGVIGFFAGKLRERYINDSLVAQVGLTIVATLFDGIVYMFFMQLIYGFELSQPLGIALMGSLFLNLGLALLLLPLLGACDSACGPNRRSSLRSGGESLYR